MKNTRGIEHKSFVRLKTRKNKVREIKFEPDEGVDFSHVDVVQLLDRGLDLVLVGLDVDEEDQGVIVFDLLHRRFGRQRVLDDVVSVHPEI